MLKFFRSSIRRQELLRPVPLVDEAQSAAAVLGTGDLDLVELGSGPPVLLHVASIPTSRRIVVGSVQVALEENQPLRHCNPYWHGFCGGNDWRLEQQSEQSERQQPKQSEQQLK